jgi:DNA-binding LacI/PurR family transcriptional regulator
VLAERGYFTIQHTTDEGYESEVEAIRALETYNLRAYVVAPVQEGKPHEHIRALIKAGKTVVCIGKLPDLETHAVDFDDHRASKEATDYLIDRGHRRIVDLAGPETSSFARHRTLGFMESLISHGLSCDESMIARAGATFAGGFEAATRVLTRGSERPTALLCFNDIVAMGAYKAAYDLALRIPDDLSVVGFDNSQLSAVMGPPLTTVATWPAQVGEAAAEIVFSALESNSLAGYLHKMTSPLLIERDSVRTLT